MALPPIEDSGDLEAPAEPLEDDGEALETDGTLDPMFAADIAEAFPELEDGQIMALQRAMLGLISGGSAGGMGGGGAPAAPGLGF